MAPQRNHGDTGVDDAVADESGGGAASLAGYEYQIDVSVWLALDLILISRQAEDLVLEPASQEDLEATLTDPEPGRLVSRVPMTGYTLIVQAKRRGGDAWTPTTLKTLLEHGSDQRISAADRLKDANSRYLLVTSAGVNGDAQKLKRRRAGTWPKPSALPRVIADGIGHDISGRLSVIANQDDERLRGDIDRLLTEGCRVPNSQLGACRTRLREDARARIARAGGGRWSRAELEAVIRIHEGYLASSPELEHYVHPNNWGDLQAAMKKGSAAIIIGQSGTGKTLATQMLYDELRKENPGLTRVLIRLGPSQLRDDTTPPPVLYDIEDPWGRFDFDPDSRPWNDQLGDFLAAARPDRMIIATSRLDVAYASGAFGTIKPWVVGLEAENYGKAERHRLYSSRIDSLPRDMQTLARTSENLVLERLATPLEIQKFFDAMRTQDRDGLKNPPGFVTAAIDHAHQNSIEQTVIEQIEKRDDVCAAAIIWALLAANDKVTRTLLREIEDGLADMDTAMEDDVSPLVDFFVAARNLRQNGGGIITYYHPRVEAGITRTLKKHRQVVRKTLRRLIELLVSELGPGAEWGAGAAARMLARTGEQFGVKPSNDVVAKIDAWLEAKLAKGGKEFNAHLELAARSGSVASNGAEMARFLLHRPDKTFPGLDTWGDPERSSEWYHTRASAPSTKPLIESFIRMILPKDRAYYPTSFVDNLGRLSSGLEEAFFDAACVVVHHGCIATDNVIAHGALNDICRFEAVIDMAVDVLTPREKDLQERAETRLDIINDVYSDDYAQHLMEDDHGYTASEFLKVYIERVRKEKGWQHIVQHPHNNQLRCYWLRALAEEAREGRVDAVEFAGAFQSGYGTKDEEDLWLALLKGWEPKYGGALETRVRQGASDVSIERAALACLIKYDLDAFSSIVVDLVEQGMEGRLVEISRGIAYLSRGRVLDGEKYTNVAEVAAARLPQPFGEICSAEIALVDKELPLLSDVAQQALAAILNAGDQVRALRLELDASITLPVEDDIRWALEFSDDSHTVVLAVEAAIRHGLTEEVEAALDHRFAHAVARAITARAASVATPLPERLLAFATHRASPVRKALVDALRTKPDPAHQTALICLAGDQWSKQTMHHGNDTDDYPIAQAAIASLLDFSLLDDQDQEDLFAIAIDTSDPEVRDDIFLLLAKSGVTMQKKLFDLAVQRRRIRPRIRSSAAYALLLTGEQLDQQLVDEISARHITTCYEPVSGVLSVLLGARGAIPTVKAVAEEIATDSMRRVLLLLVAWSLNDRSQLVAQEIAQLLPAAHKAVAWALGTMATKIDDATIADLGDPATCAEVLRYMELKGN